MNQKNLTTLLWLLVFAIPFVGLYFATRDVPEAASRSTVNPTPPAVASQEPATQKSTDAEAPPEGPQIPDYWTYLQTWEDYKANNTSLAFKRWAEEQEGQEVILDGEVRDVDDSFGRGCIVVIRGPERFQSEGFHADCDEVSHLQAGNPIRVRCTVDGKNFLDDPDLEDCEVL